MANDIPRGDSHIFRYQITDTDGNPVNIGAGGPYGVWTNFRFTLKFSPRDTDLQAVCQKTFSPVNGITIVTAATGLLQIELLPADTAHASLIGIRRPVALVSDIQGTDGNGRVWTSKRGLVTVLPTATRTSP
jgi:hypothetical protein